MRILIIDNFDSFTYNLYHIVDQFTSKCDVVRSNAVTEIDVKNYDKIILSPGPSLPSNNPVIFDLLQEYLLTKPILGICLGHQAIAEYFGSKLKNMEDVKHGVTSKNTVIFKDPLFSDIPNQFLIGHYHSWIVEREYVSSSLQITSENEDKLVMSFRHKDLDICGLQFHPESILTQYGNRIIQNWIES